MRAHYRAELHPYARQPHLAPASAEEQPISLENLRTRIRESKERLS